MENCLDHGVHFTYNWQHGKRHVIFPIRGANASVFPRLEVQVKQVIEPDPI
jgi:hypothetical protein